MKSVMEQLGVKPMMKDSTGTTFTTVDSKPISAPLARVQTDYGPGTMVGKTIVLDKHVKNN